MHALQDFREPLYLTDTAVQLEDTRSAEERKYPQLFRHKLKGDQSLYLSLAVCHCKVYSPVATAQVSRPCNGVHLSLDMHC